MMNTKQVLFSSLITLSMIVPTVGRADEGMAADMAMMEECSLTASGFATVRKYVEGAAMIGLVGYAYARGRRSMHKEIEFLKQSLHRVETTQGQHTTQLHTVNGRVGTVLKNQDIHASQISKVESSQQNLMSDFNVHADLTKTQFQAAEQRMEGILKNQAEHTGYFGKIESNQHALEKGFNTHADFAKKEFELMNAHNKAAEKRFGDLRQEIGSMRQHQDEDHIMLKEILSEVTTHREESKKGFYVVAQGLQGMYDAVKTKVVKMAA